MNKTRGHLWLCLLLLWLVGIGVPAWAEAEDLPEWTFMMYMCGSDLESAQGLASYNLREIASMWFPEQVVVDAEGGLALADWQGGGVNLVMQTGGARRWHSMEADAQGKSLGIQIASDRLQRYTFDMEYFEDEHGYMPSLRLVEEQPLASMSAPETLSNFIRWAVSEYPAKKYGLLLWDHGGGSRTGLFVDELFGNDIMVLSELGEALTDGGEHFELVAIDACLMCSLETAQMIAPHAKYMVASEEEASGYGSAFADWIMELYRNPGCDGAALGRVFCDATQSKYARQSDALSETQLTYSLIRLDGIADVANGFDRLFDFAGRLYETYPSRFNMFCNLLISGETYGAGNVDMIDLGSFLYDDDTVALVDADARNALVRALDSAVCYNVKGSARSASKGLSFCYSPEMAPEEMDLYARNCQSAPYLALLDAVMPDWQAPAWVYERARRLTPIEDMEAYHMTLELICENGLPKLHVLNREGRLFSCMYNLYASDENNGALYALGDGQVFVERNAHVNDICYVMNDWGHWPTIEGELCCVEMIDMSNGQFLYNIPIQIDADYSNLRLRQVPTYDAQTDHVTYEYEIMGIWPGYNEETRMPGRAVISLHQLQGREYQLLYPYCDGDGVQRGLDRLSDYLTMYRGLYVEYTPLPAGEYYCRYTVKDIFRRDYSTELVKLYWDGRKYNLAE